MGVGMGMQCLQRAVNWPYAQGITTIHVSLKISSGQPIKQNQSGNQTYKQHLLCYQQTRVSWASSSQTLNEQNNTSNASYQFFQYPELSSDLRWEFTILSVKAPALEKKILFCAF